jgi:energy-coupling factor transport system ATP-binding protein
VTVVLAVKDLSLSYREGEWLCRDLNFSLHEGEMLGVIGPSGCGKSTLCLALSGIIPHRADGHMEGDVFLLGENTRTLSLPRIATRAGIVFQDPETQLFLPQIRQELAFGPENLCRPREEIARRVDDVAALTVVEALLPDNPNEISGGQRQLAALAAVLCLDPAVLICDEVASQLDEAGCRRILEVIRQLKERGKTIVMVDHNLSRLRLADRILAINSGGVCALGPARDFLNNPSLVAQCFGDSTGKVVL